MTSVFNKGKLHSQEIGGEGEGKQKGGREGGRGLSRLWTATLQRGRGKGSYCVHVIVQLKIVFN